MCGYNVDDSHSKSPPATEVYSGVQHFLNSNDAPSGTTRTGFELALAEEGKRLASIDARIQNIQLELAELIKQRAGTECKIKDYKLILHPVRRLPAEILSKIFLHFVNEDLETDEDESSIDPTSMIWRLPRISQLWRFSALSFRRLWSTVGIVLTQQLNKRTQFMLSMQLHRSGSHPLSVSIYAKSDNFALEHPLLQVLLPTSERWNDFLLYMPMSSYKKIPPWITSFPQLTSLHIWFINYNPEVDQISDSGVADIVLASPNIQSMWAAPDLLSKMPIPVGQIEEFYCVSSSSASQCLEGLRPLLHLRGCGFGFYHDMDTNMETQEFAEVHLPHLRKLIIHTERYKPSPIFLLKYLQLPALDHLDLDQLSSIDNLLHFLERSQCRLTRLRLSGSAITDIDCILVFKAIPSLTFLTLHCPAAYTKKLLESLGDGEARLLPSLKFFEIVVDTEGPEWRQEDLLEFKESRPDVIFFGDYVFMSVPILIK